MNRHFIGYIRSIIVAALAADVERYKGELIYVNNLLELANERISILETQLKIRAKN